MKRTKKNRKVKSTIKCSPRQFQAHAKASLGIVDAAKYARYNEMTEEDIKEREIKATTIMEMVYLLAQVQNDYIEIAVKIFDEIGHTMQQERNLAFKAFFANIEKLKGQTAEMAWVVSGAGKDIMSNFYRDADYMRELVPLFLDRIGENKRTDYVAQCILQNIYDGYTPKLGIFEEYGFKHLTRTKTEAERMRQINRWKRNQREIKAAVIAGRTPPAELPFPFPELDKQNYLDF